MTMMVITMMTMTKAPSQRTNASPCLMRRSCKKWTLRTWRSKRTRRRQRSSTSLSSRTRQRSPTRLSSRTRQRSPTTRLSSTTRLRSPTRQSFSTSGPQRGCKSSQPSQASPPATGLVELQAGHGAEGKRPC